MVRQARAVGRKLSWDANVGGLGDGRLAHPQAKLELS